MRHFYVVRFDTRGHGGSDAPPGPYSIDQLADDAQAVIAAARLTHYHYWGISLGGMIGMELAARKPTGLKNSCSVILRQSLTLEFGISVLQLSKRVVCQQLLMASLDDFSRLSLFYKQHPSQAYPKYRPVSSTCRLCRLLWRDPRYGSLPTPCTDSSPHTRGRWRVRFVNTRSTRASSGGSHQRCAHGES